MDAIRSPTRRLASQFRIIFSELGKAHAGGGPPPAPAPLVAFGRRYVAEIYLCANELRQEVERVAPGADDEAAEIRAELHRTLWGSCLFELALIVFLQRPLVLGEALVPWWHLHLSDRRAEEQELPLLEASDAPELSPTYWPTLRSLVAHGLPELALRLLRRHGPSAPDAEPMLLRLEALLEQLPRLNDAELLQPHLESAALPALPAELLAHFQLRHRVWKADVGALARDAAGATADPTAAHIAAVARVLDGDDAAIADAVGAAGWHAKLLAKLLYAQPTLFRWQVRQLVSECAPPPSETDAFDRALIATLSDDPYAAMQSVREAYGDGWVVAHLCDLLWRAGAVSLEPMGEPAVDLRQHFVLQYSKALAGCRALWQLAAAYAIDLLEADPACAPARAWLGQLLLSQRASHTVKVRKLLALCERHGLDDTAAAIVRRRGGKGSAPDAPLDAAPMRVETAAALAPSFEAGADPLARADEGAATAARLAALAGAALTEALSHAGGGGGGGGNAIGELRALLRSSGVVGPAYYAGPRWLPHAYAAVAFVGGGCADAERAAFRAAVLSLCAELRHGGAARAEAGTPPPLLARLLSLLAGAEPAPRPFAPCRLVGGAVEAGGFGADEVRVLLSTAEEVRAAMRSAAPSEGADSRAHSLSDADQRVSLALTQALSAAILREASAGAGATAWGAVM